MRFSLTSDHAGSSTRRRSREVAWWAVLVGVSVAAIAADAPAYTPPVRRRPMPISAAAARGLRRPEARRGFFSRAM